MAALLNEWFMFSAMASGAEEHSGSLEKHTSDISIFLPTLKIWIDFLGQILPLPPPHPPNFYRCCCILHEMVMATRNLQWLRRKHFLSAFFAVSFVLSVIVMKCRGHVKKPLIYRVIQQDYRLLSYFEW